MDISGKSYVLVDISESIVGAGKYRAVLNRYYSVEETFTSSHRQLKSLFRLLGGNCPCKIFFRCSLYIIVNRIKIFPVNLIEDMPAKNIILFNLGMIEVCNIFHTNSFHYFF
jgi:hypothetical protein